MGIPKFFRWMSERYPAISQLIAENRIPEFDCLYLDMNSIIHNCTHSDSDSPSFRMTEEKMFIGIFNYIEHLFGKIKPKQLFFMAIDGVAPRAKMNQQRARRFRTALDAEKAKEKAIREGVKMPAEDAFDSNCITPGTEFMAKLTRQLKYFINKKVSEDGDWQGVDIILSGHEVPGEGEHKIMEYIRLAKAQPDYNPNIRHCLYGLDADLIMLGLLSHDPHFCLLREEVTFGRQAQKKSKELEHQNFYLMHLCIVREYLELEFQEVKDPAIMSFTFDMERIIDDFILMAFFVGNDFLPNLPNLHINEGALAVMFKVYKSVLPKAGGYINESGVINLDRLAILIDELSDVEYRFFESDVADAKWFRGKQLEKPDIMAKEKPTKKSPLTITTAQQNLFKQVRGRVLDWHSDRSQAALDLSSTLPARDRKFVEDLADDLGLRFEIVEDKDSQRHVRLSLPASAIIKGEDSDDDDDEALLAMSRVIKHYESAAVVDVSAEQARDQRQQKYELEFQRWKDQYYTGKFEWGLENREEMRKLAENYVQGLQWVLYYYYRGVASWPWFYAYHYSPMISDVKQGLKADMTFSLGQPFRPYQQLMGVLPDRSKRIVPTAYHNLMTNADSPIIDLYPREFELDMNGKKMEWEAVVKIPFIDEKRLLKAMQTKDHLLSKDEKARNEFGVSLKFTYDPDLDFTYPSSLVDILPDLSHCRCVENIFDLPTMDGLDVFVGLIDGVQLGVSALAGFPSLKVLPFHGGLGFHSVNVFQQDSRNESMVVTALESESRTKVQNATNQLDQKVYVGYPFVQEAKIVRVSDELFDYTVSKDNGSAPVSVPHGPFEIDMWRKKAERIEHAYSKRLGMVIGQVESIVHVEMLKGLKKTDDGATVKEYGTVTGIETDYASQMVVSHVLSDDQRFIEKEALPIEEEFPEGTRAFFLGEFNYGRPLEIVRHLASKAEVWILTVKGKEAEFGQDIARQAEYMHSYIPSYSVARMLGLNPLVLSKITSSFQVVMEDGKVNLGLNLKFEFKKLKVLGYSRRSANGWEFSEKAIELLQQYMVKFPEFIAGIQRNPQGNIYTPTEFYPEQEAQNKVREIQAWLKSIESRGFEKVPLEAEQLDSEVVMKIETAADDALRTGSLCEGKKIKGVPRGALLKPSDAEHRLGNQRFALGDRIVYVQDSGRVPIASRGTVVGMTRTPRTTLLDVVFDVTFMSGTTLNDRCSPFRGATIPVSSVLNLSFKQIVFGSKAADSHKPQPDTKPLTPSENHAQAGPIRWGQLRPANTPPPLGGSFRGAIMGHHNGRNGGGRTRGRGEPGYDSGPDRLEQSIPFRNQHAMPNGHGRESPNAASWRNGRGGGGSRPPHSNPNPWTERRDNTGLNAWQGTVNNGPQSYHRVPPPPVLQAHGLARGRGGVLRRASSRGRMTTSGRGVGSGQQQE